MGESDGSARGDARGVARRAVGWAVVAAPWAAAAKVAGDLWGRGTAAEAHVIDFDAFRAVGALVAEGRAVEAYRHESFLAAVRAVSTEASFAPWAYPPPAGFAVAPLALVPAWLAFALAMALSLAAWQWVVRRVAGPWATLALAAALPPALVNAISGQNGLLAGALVGLTVLGLGRARGGVPLGLLALKPHLGVLVGVWALLRRRWAAAAVAAAVVALLALAATLAFGPAVWPAWRGALGETGAHMAEGRYPLARMVSVYATLRAMWFPPSLAMAGHAAVALAAVLLVAATVRDRWAARRGAAVAVLGSLLLSPYLYDYDLPMLAVALGLAAPDLSARGRWAAAALAALAGGWGTICVWAPRVVAVGEDSVFLMSLGAVPLVALAVLVAGSLERAERRGRDRDGAARLRPGGEPG